MRMIPRDNPLDPFDRTVRQMIGQLSELDSHIRPQFIHYADQYIDDNQLVVTMDIPDVEKEDIEVRVQSGNYNQILLISATENQTNIQRQFRQKIPLQKRVDPQDTEAEYNNGILTIRLTLDEQESDGIDIDIE